MAARLSGCVVLRAVPSSRTNPAAKDERVQTLDLDNLIQLGDELHRPDARHHEYRDWPAATCLLFSRPIASAAGAEAASSQRGERQAETKSDPFAE
jgi:hypothetical protein